MLDYINPESLYEENIFAEFLGGPVHKLLTEARRNGQIRHFAPAGPSSTRFYMGADVIAWIESFEVKATPPAAEPAPTAPAQPAAKPVVVVDAGKASDTLPKGK